MFIPISSLFLGVCKAMSSTLKEKFRHSSKNKDGPSSNMIKILIENQTKQLDLQDSLKLVLQKAFYSADTFVYCFLNSYNLMYIPSNIVTKYLNSYFLSKRQQFLHAACYEQFFVVGYADVNFFFNIIDQVVLKTKEMFSDYSEVLNWIICHLVSDCTVIKVSSQSKNL